jgi:streptogramin lyase
MPNDFTLGIDYTAANNPGPDTYPLTTGAESVAVDRIGNAWFTTQPNKGTGAGYMFEMNPAGVVNSSVTQYNSSYIYGYVTIDSGQSAWAGSANSTNAITYVHSTNGSTLSDYVGQVPGTYTYSAGATNATLLANYTYAAVASSSGNVYFGSNKTAGGSSDYIESFLGAATTPSVLGVLSGILSGLSTDGQGISHGAIDASGDAFFNYNAASGHGTPYVTRIALGTGLTASGFPVSNATSGCTSMLDPEQMTVVRSGDIIQPDYYNGAGTTNTATSSVYYITSAGVCTQLSGATLKAGLSSPFGSATDGLDYVYITNRGAGSISVLDTSGGTAASTVAVSPSNGYEPQLQSGSTLNAELSDPLNIAIDPSGNAWVTDYGNDSIVELVGIAVPATTPLANAAIPISYTQGSIGYKP